MSNLSKGTGSRKDTKMRIRAFPVSRFSPPGTPGPGARPKAAREARAELPQQAAGPASPPPRRRPRGASLPGNRAARGSSAAASRAVPRAPVRRRAPAPELRLLGPRGRRLRLGPLRRSQHPRPRSWGVGPTPSIPLLGSRDPRPCRDEDCGSPPRMGRVCNFSRGVSLRFKK